MCLADVTMYDHGETSSNQIPSMRYVYATEHAKRMTSELERTRLWRFLSSRTHPRFASPEHSSCGKEAIGDYLLWSPAVV